MAFIPQNLNALNHSIMEALHDRVKTHGGKIVASTSCTPDELNKAIADMDTYKDDSGFRFVYLSK